MSIQKALEELRQTYLKNLPDKIANVEKLFSQGSFGPGELQAMRSEFHKLKGTGKTYGFPEITRVGQVMEKLCASEDRVRIERSVPIGLELLRRIYDERKADRELDTESDQEFLVLIELTRGLEEN